MKIEKLTENKIRIIVNLIELNNNNLKLKDFINNNIESQKFFLKILNKAEKEVGFKTNNCKLLIETFSSIDNLFIFTITKILNKQERTKKKYTLNKNSCVLKNPIYKFSSFEEFCILCTALSKSNININRIAKTISLYFYNNTYYLLFKNINLTNTELKKVLSILSEFTTIINKPDYFESKIIEFGKPILKQNAFKTGIKYFI